MGFRIREFEAEGKFCHHLSLKAIERVVPSSVIKAVLVAEGAQEQRERKLNAFVTILLVIAMNLFTELPLQDVLKKIARGLRYVWPDDNYQVAGKGAINYRRYQLGARPLVTLFRSVCQPMATRETQGAFLFGLRVMAIDGSTEDVADTPENAAVFGRHSGGERGDGAFPQIRCIYLAECGTHAIVDAGLWPCHTDEHQGACRLLRSVKPGMLVMWDCGLHSFDLILAVLERESQVLARLPAGAKPRFVQQLPDGTYLAYLYPSERQRRKRGEHLLVRIMEYTVTDPARPGYDEIHRLVTTLLDPESYPALDLICAYHERWEIELAVDEMDTHQRLLTGPLRSKKPVGVIQELYGLLIAHYVIRCLMHEAALQAGVDPDRISFVNALRVIKDAVPEFEMTLPEQLPRLYARLLRDIADELLPPRRLRLNPRVVKRKMSKFLRKRQQHYHWPQPSCPFREAVALI